MISPPITCGGTGEAGGGGFTGCAVGSCAVWAAAGAAIASTDVPISNAVEMRMRPSPFWPFCCVADIMPETTIDEEERAARRVAFRPPLLQDCYNRRSRRTATTRATAAMAC